MSRLGTPILQFDTLASTNDYAKDLAAAGAAEGTTVTARTQTQGRGRQGRTWSSLPDAGLYFSVILRPRLAPARSSVLTLAAAVAVAETFREEFHLPADIKWPNDILVGGRKICGILVESAIEGTSLQYAILGIGVNLAHREFSDELRALATSLFLESGAQVSPQEFLSPLIQRMDGWYRKALANPQEVIARWEELSSYARDCLVRISSEDENVEGITRGLTANGGLRLELASGEMREIVSGDVSLRQREP